MLYLGRQTPSLHMLLRPVQLTTSLALFHACRAAGALPADGGPPASHSCQSGTSESGRHASVKQGLGGIPQETDTAMGSQVPQDRQVRQQAAIVSCGSV